MSHAARSVLWYYHLTFSYFFNLLFNYWSYSDFFFLKNFWWVFCCFDFFWQWKYTFFEILESVITVVMFNILKRFHFPCKCAHVVNPFSHLQMPIIPTLVRQGAFGEGLYHIHFSKIVCLPFILSVTITCLDAKHLIKIRSL